MFLCTKAGKGNAKKADAIINGTGQGSQGLFQCQEPYCLKNFDNEMLITEKNDTIIDGCVMTD